MQPIFLPPWLSPSGAEAVKRMISSVSSAIITPCWQKASRALEAQILSQTPGVTFSEVDGNITAPKFSFGVAEGWLFAHACCHIPYEEVSHVMERSQRSLRFHRHHSHHHHGSQQQHD